MTTSDRLRQQLLALDQCSYKAYQDLGSDYQFPDFTLLIDWVQGDPFASPSQVRVVVEPAIAGFPAALYQSRSRQIALQDYLCRQCNRVADSLSRRSGTGNSGLIRGTELGQEVLARTMVLVSAAAVEARFRVGLPAEGRRVLGRQAAELLCDRLPQLVHRALKYANLEQAAIQRHVEQHEDADALRQQLQSRGLVAFVADGAILPRRSGVDDQPLHESVLPFQSPPDLRVTLTCPNRGSVTGMGIPHGVTLIVGGGYHGKSTLLRAIERGVYNHVPDDGREWVVTAESAVKIRAEDGRSITGVNISPFITHLPQGRSTRHFSTANASGSTSQAANIVEALEAGATVLLLDEDTCATNFMIRDRRMQALVAKEREPITPLIDRVRQLYTDYGVSTVLVMGGSGDYFDVADTVIALDNFQPQVVTATAKAIAAQYATGRQPEGGTLTEPFGGRIILPDSLQLSDRKPYKARDLDELVLGREQVDLGAVEQLVEMGQIRAIGSALVYARQHLLNGRITLAELLDQVMSAIASQGLDSLSPFPRGDFAQFRRTELAATLNRLRTLRVK